MKRGGWSLFMGEIYFGAAADFVPHQYVLYERSRDNFNDFWNVPVSRLSQLFRCQNSFTENIDEINLKQNCGLSLLK